MRTTQIAATALNAALYIAVGVVFSSLVPIRFEGVRFWPPVVVPAIFAVFFGPWTGGIGAAIGIFISDIILGNNPVLSLMAGITSNFAMFFIVGYLANRKTKLVTPAVIYGIVTLFLTWLATIYADTFWIIVIIASYVIFLILALLAEKWNSYHLSTVTGLLVGSAIIAFTVPLFAYLFTPVGQPPIAEFTLPAGLSLFIFTFATQIPFLIILGPPIIEAVKKAFPNLQPEQTREET